MSYRFLPLVIVTLLFGSGCNEGESPTAALSDREQQIDRLTRTWTADRVVYQGVAVTEPDFADFTLTFAADSTWTARGGAPVFGTTGTWQLAATDVRQLTLSGLPTVLTIGADARLLRLEFLLTGGSISGRTTGLEGDYLMEFSAPADEDL